MDIGYEYHSYLLPDEMRLLHFEPSTTPGYYLFHGKLKTYARDHHPPYVALSYFWKDGAGPDIRMKIDDYNVKLSWNVHKALEQLMCLGAMTVWIDRVCINQKKGSLEKEEQVRRIRGIYEEASLVFGWLGDTDEMAPHAFRTLEQIARNEIHFHDENLDPILWLMSRKWFHRVWIIQEVTVARNAVLQCGPYQIPWDTCITAFGRFFDIYAMRERDREIIGSGVEWIGKRIEHFIAARLIKQLSDNTHSRIPVTLALRLGCSDMLEATDPRDRVWGLLGLMREGERLNIPVDYDGSMTYQELFKISMEQVGAVQDDDLPLAEYRIVDDILRSRPY